MRSFLKNNGLSIVILLLALIFLVGQYFTGWKEYNKERRDMKLQEVEIWQYVTSGHFIESTFENWESEFLQMALYVLLTIYLRQKGSAESKKISEEEDVDREPVARKNAPWPVKKGGIWLALYKNSLTLVFALLFILSFILHFYGSLKDHHLQQIIKNEPLDTACDYLLNYKFWFESFQNWQSEFIAIAALVLFTIWFRQKGSPQSKPVDASNDETGN